MKDPIDLYNDAIRWLENDLWQIRTMKAGKFKRFWVHNLRVFVLAVRGFVLDHASVRASALTFYSLLSVVPLIALVIGLSQGFGLKEQLRTQLFAQFPQQEELIEQITLYAERFLEQSSGGVITGIGIVLLVWTIIRLLSHIERALNHVWKVEHGRRLIRKITDFLTIAILGPVLLLVSSSMTVYVSTAVTDIASSVEQIGLLPEIVEFVFKLSPYVLAWILFAFVYIVMPNGNVPIKSNLAAAVIAGTMFQLMQWGYVESQVGVSKYGAVYGSLAALPLFLIWLQLSWMVVLFGAEVAYGIEHVETYEGIATVKEISAGCRRLIELTVLHHVVKVFDENGGSLDSGQIAKALGLPSPIADDALQKGVRAELLSMVTDDEDNLSYQPSLPPDRYKLSYVIAKLESIGQTKPPIADRQEVRAISDALAKMQETLAKSDADKRLTEI